jgi:exopolysaccharide production protein ExoQ
MGEQLMSTLTLPISSGEVSTRGRTVLYPCAVGFFFVFRVCLTLLFFQSNPVLGGVAIILVDFALLYGAVLYSTDVRAHGQSQLLQIPPIRWLFAYLALSAMSVLWTGAQSPTAALAYWAGMTADVFIVALLLRSGDVERNAEGLLKGVVLGAVSISIIAWCSPVTADLRLGNDLFLHPNMLGMEIGVATLIAQYLAPRGVLWKWLSIALAITLLRILSKTAIIAFVVAECWYLMQNNQMTRKAKARLAGAVLLIVASLWSPLNSYIAAYNNTGSGNQVETLTGRTLVWTVAFTMSLEKPWLGHGFYSFRTLIPAFGTFQPVHAHNELLQQFFEYGLAGVVIVAGLYWSFFRHTLRAPASELRTLALTVLLFALVRGLADTVLFGLSYPLWLFTALSLCLTRSERAPTK